jgi:tetratricopeptide (TPR) repeat protein
MEEKEQPALPSSQQERFGERLRRHRLRLGLSQEALAEAIGASARSIGRWEQDLAIPQELFRARLAQVFEIDARQLLVSVHTEGPQQATPSSPLWTVPFARNPCFTGREEMLHTLQTRLTPQQPLALAQASALSGLGGIGKTQVAIEYAYRSAPAYQAVFWLAAETTESLMRSLQVIAEALELPERNIGQQAQMVAAVQRWLSTHAGWLLIGDNVEDLNLLQTVLPPRRSGALLLTTRRQALGLLADPLELPPMSHEEGVALLLRRARQLSAFVPGAALPQDMPLLTPAAAELVTLLEGLPLALDQAGAYIEETGCSVADYLERYHSQRKHVLARRGMHGGAHPASVTTTLMLAVECIASKHPAAAEFLRACAFLHPEALPEELLMAGGFHLGPALHQVLADPYQFDLVVAALRSASLMTRSPEMRTLSVHRLVQAVLQDQMEEAEARLWSERVVCMVNAAFPEETFDTWAVCERYLVQALACLSLIEQAHRDMPEAGTLLYKVGSYLVARGRYGEAKPLLLQAVELAEQQHDSDLSALLVRLMKLAELFWQQGKYAEAEQVLHRMLALREQHLEPDPLQRAELLNNLALLYQEQGMYSEAEPLYQQALASREEHLGLDHLLVSETLTNLGLLYWKQGKYSEAEPLHERALHIRELQLGFEHPDTAITLGNLAAVYRDQGKYSEAEPLYLRSLRIREQHLGSEHPSTARMLNNIANLYRDQGKHEQAEQLYQRALRILEQQLEPEHPLTVLVLNNVANLYRDQRKYSEAELLYQRSLRIREQHLGAEHPDTGASLIGLATVYRDQEIYEKAEPLFLRALVISEQHLGSAHPKTRKIRDDYRHVLAQRRSVSEMQGKEEPGAEKRLE